MELYYSVPDTARLLVGLCGIPASGKTTLAQLIIKQTNALAFLQSGQEIAILVGLDGWHLTRAQLDRFSDAKLAHDRRGAHWTFDGKAYVEFIKELRLPLTPAPDAQESHMIIRAPSFDHALKDPTPSAVSILSSHRIVLIEGLYTFLSVDPWREAAEMMDERWFVDVDIEEATRRLVKRHVISGVAKDIEEAVWRAEENDMPSE